ncbi:MAG: phosphatidate cytidylyltransferase [Holosporales bacterium]|jgi:phosphatidate cytidylyltransferase|nr:phosphatidate cytidylyltransferase [Holosporales bacterium]
MFDSNRPNENQTERDSGQSIVVSCFSNDFEDSNGPRSDASGDGGWRQDTAGEKGAHPTPASASDEESPRFFTNFSTLKQRVISGGVIVALLFLVVLSGLNGFSVFMAITSGIITFEWARIANRQSRSPNGAFLSMVAQYFSFKYGAFHTGWIIFLCLCASLEIVFIQYNTYIFQGKMHFKQIVREQRKSILIKSIGYIYIFQAVWCLVEIYKQLGTFTLWIFLTVWLTDSGAFFVGRKFGKRKLAPRISPQKTWEGLSGGTACALAIVVGSAVAIVATTGTGFVLPEMSLILSLSCLTFFVSICSHIGDLLESAGKRFFAVKDSGNIIPGHGGLADRFDSLLFVGLALYYLLVMFGVLRTR